MSEWHPGIPEEFRDRVTVGSCLPLLLRLPDACVDGVLTDPPYSSGGLMRGDRNGGTQAKYTLRDNPLGLGAFSGDNRDQRAFGYWCALWLEQCLRVTKPGGVLCMFTDWRQLPQASDALQAGGWVWRGIVPWDKTEGARPTKGSFRNQCEYVLWGSAGPLREPGPESPCLPGCFRLYQKPGEKVHIAGKPVGLLRQLLPVFPRGGTVLDPFAGAGSTGMACAEEGYRFIGFEIEGSWAEVAQARTQAAGRVLFRGADGDDAFAQGGLPL